MILTVLPCFGHRKKQHTPAIFDSAHLCAQTIASSGVQPATTFSGAGHKLTTSSNDVVLQRGVL